MLPLYCFAVIVACFSPLCSAVIQPPRSTQSPADPTKIAVIRAADDVVATVTVTNMHTSTVLITTSSFAYSVSTAIIEVTSTKTTFVSSASPPSRRLKERAIPNENIKRAAATTSTTTVDAGFTVTSTINVGATHFDQTVTSTVTATLALAAPTFSHVYAAAAGCQNSPTVEALQLDPGITDKDSAISICQESCSQNGECASLFVQYLFPNYGSASPVYKCFMNGQGFDESSNLVCGLAENIWGAADAYDAVGRGASP